MKMLSAPDTAPRMIAPTTTLKMAQRMLSASRHIARAMPPGFYAPTALDILLIVHIAEDDARYLSLHDMDVPGAPPAMVIERWLTALTAQKLIERRGELIALSEKGYALVTTIIESVYAAQRDLD